MWRVAPLLVLLLVAQVASPNDLPPGALVRLGDDRFRAGGEVSHLALSPDGKQFATAHSVGSGAVAVAVWDADTGRPVHERVVNERLFKGLVWGTGGAYAVVIRAEPGQNGKPAKGFPDDFCVWDFTDPNAGPSPVPPGISIERITGTIHDALPVNDREYTDFLFSGDGTRLAARWAAEGKHAVHVFELKPANTAAKLKRVGTIDLGAESVEAVRISADGKTLVTFRTLAEPDGTHGAEFTATVWDVAAGKPAQPVRVSSTAGEAPRQTRSRDPKRIENRLMLAPDGGSLVLHAAGEKGWGFDRTDIGSLFKKRELIRLPYGLEKAGAHDSGGYAFFPSGKVLAVATDLKTLVIDSFTGKELGRLEGHAGTPCAVAVSADGTRIATADSYGLVRLWNAKTYRPVHDVPGHRAPVEHAELSPDGKRLLTWAPDETVRIWDVATGTELRAFAGARSNHPTFTPDGTTILYSTEKRLIGRDLQTGLEVPLPGDLAKLNPRNAAFAPDGKALLTWSHQTHTLAVWDWPGGKKRFELAGQHSMGSPDFSPNGAAVRANGDSPKWWDAKTGKELAPAWAEIRQFAPPSSPSLWLKSPDGQQLLRNESGRVQVCEVATGQVRRELSGHRGRAYGLGFTPNGTKLLTAGEDHTVLVWDVRLQNVPLPDAIKKETNAAKLWDTLATGKADAAYLAMARLAREPDTAVKMAKMRLKPAAKGDRESDPSNLADARAVELLEALETDDSRALLKELAGGHADAFRTQEAKRALERHK